VRIQIESVSDFDAGCWRWLHFTPQELACRCGGRFCAGEYWHAPEFLEELYALRAGVGCPLVISSWHRCAVWNTHVWGARFSLHGSATVAVSPNGHARRTLLVAAELQKAEASGPRAGLSASMAAEAAIGDSCRWVNAVRAMTRPTLTVLLWGITGAAFLGADEAGQAGIVYTATFAETAATLRWFGDRGPRREAR
jgi:hypothetical protein